MAKEMSLSGRWGNSCGIAFDAKKYIDKHPQWSDYAPYLLDRPSQKWSVFKQEHVSNTKHSNTKHSNSNTKHSNTMKKKRRIRSRTIKNKK
jgi:hypothetical protein